MKKVIGFGKRIECVNPKIGRYVVRWDIKPYYTTDANTGSEIQNGCEYYEKWIDHKPTINEVKDIVLSGMNTMIDQQILEGFEWNGMPVWLSSENQFNYKAAYDLAAQTNGKNLPVVFKFGTTDNPVYHTFEDVQSLTEFYTSAMSYINDQLAEGWKKKDSVDWSEYEALLQD